MDRPSRLILRSWAEISYIYSQLTITLHALQPPPTLVRVLPGSATLPTSRRARPADAPEHVPVGDGGVRVVRAPAVVGRHGGHVTVPVLAA